MRWNSAAVQPSTFSRTWDHGVIGPALAASAAVLIGPLRHLNKVHDVVRQGGHHNGHSGGAAARALPVLTAPWTVPAALATWDKLLFS